MMQHIPEVAEEGEDVNEGEEEAEEEEGTEEEELVLDGIVFADA